MKYGLEENTIGQMVSVFRRHEQIEEVILFGSRAKGNQKLGSDIDLALKGNGLTLAILNKITDELDALPMPYTFDICVLTKIENKELVEHIKRVGQNIYKKN